MQNIIEADNLSFTYSGEPILNKVGFSIQKGDFTAVIGSNGAGKSTLLRLLLGELMPTDGSIRLFGQEAARFKDWPRLGYVMQAAAQSGGGFPATAEEIVMANLYSQIGLFRFPGKEHRQRTCEALRLVGMDAYAKRLFSEMSGGQQQRVMLARVLVSQPEVMLLDEPTTGIDEKSTIALCALLQQLNKDTGLTIMMVTHDISRISDYVTRVLCLENGSMHEVDRPSLDDELSHKHKHPH